MKSIATQNIMAAQSLRLVKDATTLDAELARDIVNLMPTHDAEAESMALFCSATHNLYMQCLARPSFALRFKPDLLRCAHALVEACHEQ